MKAETVKAIFTNVLFVIGVGLIIFGFIYGSSTVSRLLAFDKYPLNSYQETQCDMQYAQPMLTYDGGGKPSPPPEDSTDEWEEQKAKCVASLEQERRVKKTDDIVSSVSTLIAGLVLVLSFRQFIFSSKK
jgi:hypothetical protein